MGDDGAIVMRALRAGSGIDASDGSAAFVLTVGRDALTNDQQLDHPPPPTDGSHPADVVVTRQLPWTLATLRGDGDGASVEPDPGAQAAASERRRGRTETGPGACRRRPRARGPRPAGLGGTRWQ